MAVARFRITERQVLLFILAASILGYVGAILVVTFRQKGKRPELSQSSYVHLMKPEASQDESKVRYIIADMFDPSDMSLPSAHGFSSSTWERQSAATHRPPEPPVELAFLNAGAPAEMQSLLDEPSLHDAVQRSVEKLAPDPEQSASIETTTATNRTVVDFTGGLEHRALAEQLELPTIASETPLRPTRLRIAVAPDGVVRYVTLERSCGNESADRQALEIARKLQFEPQGSPNALELTWGVARFAWATGEAQN